MPASALDADDEATIGDLLQQLSDGWRRGDGALFARPLPRMRNISRRPAIVSRAAGRLLTYTNMFSTEYSRERGSAERAERKNRQAQRCAHPIRGVHSLPQRVRRCREAQRDRNDGPRQAGWIVADHFLSKHPHGSLEEASILAPHSRLAAAGMAVISQARREYRSLTASGHVPRRRGFRRDEGAAGGPRLHQRPRNRPAETGPRHRHGDSHPQRHEPAGRCPRIDEAADDLGGIRADASSATAGSHPSIAWPATAPRGQTMRTDATADTGPQASGTRRGIAAGPEPRSRANLDRPLPEADELVGLSGAADRRVLARRVRRRARRRLVVGDDQ